MGVARWIWIFYFYSFGGYLLEKGFARVTRAANQSRKCLLFLPLCPVYGLALAAVLALPAPLTRWPVLPFAAAAVTTGVEYIYHWGCETFLGVRFWDYSGTWGSFQGRVCLPFTLAWGLLTAAAVGLFQPLLERLIPLIPPWAALAAVLALTADAVCTVRYLAVTHNPANLSPARLRLREGR